MQDLTDFNTKTEFDPADYNATIYGALNPGFKDPQLLYPYDESGNRMLLH